MRLLNHDKFTDMHHRSPYWLTYMQRVKVIDLCLSFLLLYWIAGIGIVIHYEHNLIHSYLQSLNPILNILKFKYLQIRHKPCKQLATNAQSVPWKSSNTTSPGHDSYARDFAWNRGGSSNSPPLTHGDQIPHPLEDSDNQFPPPRDGKGLKCPQYARRGGGGMLKLRFDRSLPRRRF